MHIKSIKLQKFRVLQDLEVKFLTPDTTTTSDKNVVNVIAGINGTGKTSLLDSIFDTLSSPIDFSQNHAGIEVTLAQPEIATYTKTTWHQLQKILSAFKVGTTKDTPRSIFLTSKLSFQYKATPQITNKYQPCLKINNSSILGDAEFYIKEFILSHERTSHTASPEARTLEAVNLFNEKFLDTELLTKLVGLDPNQFNRPVFINAAGEKVTIDQLSDGEKQLYGRVISLMILEPNNSTILIDEPEIALHPAWQQQIMSIYSKIGKNNQFIVATHSPQIIANTRHENLIILNKENGKITPLYPNSPPSGVDVNSILAQVMGVKSALPKDVDELHRKYRQLVKDKNENTDEAESIKESLLSRESNDSKFMQEMRLLIRLRGSK